MSSTSGRARTSQPLTRSSRAFSELTFQVAMRMAPGYPGSARRGVASGGAGPRDAGRPGARVPDQVAEHVHEERGPQDAEPGKRREPPGRVDVLPAVRQHAAPGRDAGGDSDTEEAQARLR